MATPNIDSLFPLIVPEVNQCPLDMIRLAIRRAARRFCQASLAWRPILGDSITLVLNQGAYPLVIPANTEILMLLNVYRPVGELTGKSMDQIRYLLPDWQAAIGLPMYFNTQDFANLNLFPAAGDMVVGDQYRVRVALAPKLTIADVPADLSGRYDEALVDGALSILFDMKDRPWAAPNRVPAHISAFERRVWEARVAVEHERTKGSIVVESVEFGS